MLYSFLLMNLGNSFNDKREKAFQCMIILFQNNIIADCLYFFITVSQDLSAEITGSPLLFG